MAFRSLGISVFILIVMLMAEFTGHLSDAQANENKTFGKFGSPRKVSELDITDDQTTLDEMLKNPAAERKEEGGGTFDAYKMADTAINVLINSTYGIGSFFLEVIQINRYDGATAAFLEYLAAIIFFLVNVNHMIAIAQLIPGISWGGNL